MESWIDEADEQLPELRAFVLPGGTAGAAALHVARTVCRRAERRVVRLSEEGAVSQMIVPYLNRLSDLLFTLARLESLRSGGRDVEWRRPAAP
jgi:cob(I)alamin adenosyltransferase